MKNYSDFIKEINLETELEEMLAEMRFRPHHFATEGDFLSYVLLLSSQLAISLIGQYHDWLIRQGLLADEGLSSEPLNGH